MQYYVQDDSDVCQSRKKIPKFYLTIIKKRISSNCCCFWTPILFLGLGFWKLQFEINETVF